MKKPALIFSAALLAFSSAIPVMASDPAAGTGSYKIDKRHLDKVKPYNAPRQIDIINESPIIHNHLVPEQEPDTFEINVSAPPVQAGRHFVIGSPGAASGVAIPFRSRNPNLGSGFLAPASDMYRTNIPARLPISNNLPAGQSTGVHGPTGQAATGKREAVATKGVSGRLDQAKSNSGPLTANSYSDYTNAQSAAGLTVRTNVQGSVKSNPLLNRLK